MQIDINNNKSPACKLFWIRLDNNRVGITELEMNMQNFKIPFVVVVVVVVVAIIFWLLVPFATWSKCHCCICSFNHKQKAKAARIRWKITCKTKYFCVGRDSNDHSFRPIYMHCNEAKRLLLPRHISFSSFPKKSRKLNEGKKIVRINKQKTQYGES